MRYERQAFAERTGPGAEPVRALAARMHAWDAAPVLEPVELAPPGPGEALVAVAAGAVAHIDLTVATGTFAHKPALPYTPGTEGAGRVVRSAHLAPGTPVRIRGGGVGLRRDGTWATHVVVPDEALAEVPEGTDLALAAGFFSPCVTAHAAVRELAAVQPGERVAVVGAAGAVGAVAVQLALDAGAQVVGLERDASRLDAVPAGATPAAPADPRSGDRPPTGAHRADPQSGDSPLSAGQGAVEAVLGATGGERVDVLIDTAGGPALPALVTGAVAPGGRAVLVGYAAGTEATFALPALLAADVRLIPMNLIRWEQRLRGVAAELLARLGRGELELARTVLPLERVGEAVAALRAGTAVGRVVVTNEGSR